MIINLKEIEELINSDVSGYQINKDTGISSTIISGLRTGQREWDNVALGTIKKLQEYIDQRKKNGELKMLEKLIEKAAYGDLTEEEQQRYNSLFMLNVELYDEDDNIMEVDFDHCLGTFETLEEAEFEAENSHISGDWKKLEFIIYHPADDNSDLYANEVKTIEVER